MTMRSTLAAGLGAFLAACASTPEPGRRTNDPLNALSASQVYVEKGIKYMDVGKYDVAKRDLERAIDLDGDNSEAYNALGVLYQRLDDPHQAEKYFRKALSVKADNFGARNNYGRFLCLQGKYAEGMEQFRQIMASRLYDQPWIALTNAGMCARSAGKKAEAEGFLREALKAEPDFPPALLELAELSQETGQHLSARAFLERYHGVARPTARSLRLGVEIERALGNAEAAADYLKTLQGRFPEAGEAADSRHRPVP
ncbi:type IV pilus biogenesis/stability protein PilW [Candidatus Methylocalor cossyra]|uniref:Type IV pilus assembly protein PilF n=1 Tax=Candidatus Methylocalor cossyra TaxID=3108543 RepID=A0ABM9NGZ8_9GAMM